MKDVIKSAVMRQGGEGWWRAGGVLRMWWGWGWGCLVGQLGLGRLGVEDVGTMCVGLDGSLGWAG